MKENAAVEKNLTVNGQSTFNNKVTITNGGLEVTGGTQTDTLHVTGDVTARSYKVGDKTYIDANGINANSQKITNVAAGTEDSDAANYGQLRKVERRVDGVENRVTNVENRVDKMDSRIDKVGANAAAMANLHPLEFDEDSKWNVAAAVGNYKGETAAAVGAFYRPNEDVMFNLSTTFGNDENMVGGGLSLRLGKGGNREKDKKLKAAIAENNDLRAKVDDLTARMDALLSVINPNMSKEFPDVPENHWAYEAVTRLAGNNIVQGYEDGKFHGERTMTRYEMAEIIYNALSRGAKAEKKLVEEFKPELQAMAAQKQAK
ncbi:MAG: YadA-like family protein [Mitsuokella jalaludinii]|nr:YadA-like family protein [Mitsuokella jalaludinii]